jgi:hypothetical protein
MNNTEIIVIVVILSFIFLISINSCSHINNILLHINNNSVRFIMILLIIMLGKYNVNIAGLLGLLFLIMINKANHIEGLENNDKSKYANLNLWLGAMLINPIKYIFLNEKYDIKQEITDMKLTDECKQFSEKYLDIMDNDMVHSIVILLFTTQSDNNIEDISNLFKTLKYEDMLVDLENLLKDEQLIEKQMNENASIANIMKEKNAKVDKNKILTKFLPFLKNNKECAMKLFNKVISDKLTKESIEKILNGIENEKQTEESDQTNKAKKITKEKLIQKSIKDDSILKCDDDDLKQEDDCNNGSVCSKGFYCTVKEKGTGSAYLCSPFKNPVICNDGRFSCPSDSKCIERQKCKDYDGNLSDQVMNSDGYTKNNEELLITQKLAEQSAQKPEVSSKSNKKDNNSKKDTVRTDSKKPSISSQSIKIDRDSSRIQSTQVIDEKIEKTVDIDSIDYDIPIAKRFPRLKNSFDKKNDHNPSYTAPIVDCGIDKHDFNRNQHICPDCR